MYNSLKSVAEGMLVVVVDSAVVVGTVVGVLETVVVELVGFLPRPFRRMVWPGTRFVATVLDPEVDECAPWFTPWLLDPQE